MSSLLQDIQAVRALRKNIRNPKLSAVVCKAIETIHQSIRNGSDHGDWKKVDWRGPSGSQKHGTFFANRSNRHDHSSSHNSSSQTHTAVFGNRYRNNHSNKETHLSIPLTNPSASSDQKESSADAAHENFEVVKPQRRHGGNHNHNHHHESSDGFRYSTPPPTKYVSRFRKATDKVEDTILNKIILGKLNKFSPSNYNEIKEFITHIIDNGETEMIKCFMKLVFEKAASEEMYCPLYAKLLSELSARYPVLLVEMANLYKQYMLIFEEVVGDNDETYNEMCKRNVEKKYRRGYSQFLAELIKNNVIDTDTFVKTINTILQQVEMNRTVKDSTKLIEELADCLMKIIKAIKFESKAADQNEDDEDEEKEESSLTKMNVIRCILKEDIVFTIQPLTERNLENAGLSNKARFTFLDIYENIQKY
jgi:hypothetical protein